MVGIMNNRRDKLQNLFILLSGSGFLGFFTGCMDSVCSLFFNLFVMFEPCFSSKGVRNQ
jgi:hypothetical protein